MDISCSEFVDALLKQSASLEPVRLQTVEYWEPDEPPVTILFAALGEGIARQFDNNKKESNLALFHLIESGMSSPNSELVTAVATGLIEAMVSQAAQVEGLWLRMSPLLGYLSRRHAESWLAFGA